MEQDSPTRRLPLSQRLSSEFCCFFGGGGGPSNDQIKEQNRQLELDRKEAEKQRKSLEKQTAQQNAQFNAQLAHQQKLLEANQPPSVQVPKAATPPPPVTDYRGAAQAADDAQRSQASNVGLFSTIIAGESPTGSLGSGDKKGKKLLG